MSLSIQFIQQFSGLHLGTEALTPDGNKWGVIASVDIEGRCLMEFVDGTSDIFFCDEIIGVYS